MDSSAPYQQSVNRALAPSSVHRGTQLGIRVYPTAGEAVIFGRTDGGLRGAFAEQVTASRALGRGGVRLDDSPPASSRAPAESTDEPAAQTVEENAERAGRRARARVRRFAVANRTTHLWTLTTAHQSHERAKLRRDMVPFLRRLRERYPRMPYLWVIEEHESGALHAHVLVNRYVPHRWMERAWRQGNVWVVKIHARRPGGGREAARVAGRYAGKYVGKSPVAGEHEHRYDVRQGFQPQVVERGADELRAALRIACAEMDGEVPSYRWSSDCIADWRGPPVLFLGW